MPVSQAHFAIFDIRIFYLTPRVSGKSAAERSLKIAEFDQRHRRFGIAFEVFHLGEQVIHELL